MYYEFHNKTHRSRTNSTNIKHMLHRIGVENINDLINQTNINRNLKIKLSRQKRISCQET